MELKIGERFTALDGVEVEVVKNGKSGHPCDGCYGLDNENCCLDLPRCYAASSPKHVIFKKVEK